MRVARWVDNTVLVHALIGRVMGHTLKFRTEFTASPRELRLRRFDGPAMLSCDVFQTLVVQVNGATLRPDGSVFHITWSIDRASGAKPVDSNKLLSEKEFSLIGPFDVETIPFVG